MTCCEVMFDRKTKAPRLCKTATHLRPCGRCFAHCTAKTIGCGVPCNGLPVTERAR